MGIVDRIVAGDSNWPEIFEHNIAVMGEMIERERNNKHDPKGCKRKYCKHGSKGIIREYQEHRDQLKRELQLVRAGVTPSNVR